MSRDVGQYRHGCRSAAGSHTFPTYSPAGATPFDFDDALYNRSTSHTWSKSATERLPRLANAVTQRRGWPGRNDVGYLNEVTLRRVGLVLGWVTALAVHVIILQAISAFHPQRVGK